MIRMSPPAGISSGENAKVITIGLSKVVPSGRNSYSGPTADKPPPDHVPSELRRIVISVSRDSAPPGISIAVPSARLTVPPPAPIVAVVTSSNSE